MTASAIEGDREKCLASGMNNYLAKPVRALTLKALLESYLKKEEKEEVEKENLKVEAEKIVREALREGRMGEETEREGSEVVKEGTEKEAGQQIDGVKESVMGIRSRPGSVRSMTQKWVGPRENKNTGGSKKAGST
jgi:YesN/AraC family two-component response regulator